jgi:SAM-dependent methyltransferase
VSLSISAVRRTFYELRTEGEGPGREACAIGVGLFIGCSPFYGFHLLMSWVCGRLFRLNRLKVYLASNISNPVVAPLLILAEIQTGAWLRSGTFLALTLQAVKTIRPWQFGLDWFLGSAVIGGVLGSIGGITTYFALRDGHKDPFFAGLVREASERYVGKSITAWEFARNKLRRDPLYREVLFRGWLPSGGKLLDIGCGQGLMLALLAEAERVSLDGSVPPGTRLPRFDRIAGIELRPHRASLARAALGPDADIIESDARLVSPGDCRAVLFFDVLHMMPQADQDALLSAAVGALAQGGVILVRETDASAGWRFHTVRIGNRLTALASGAWGQRFSFRTLREWHECFARHGLDAESAPAGTGTPFANHLFRLTVRPAESAATFRREQSA